MIVYHAKEFEDAGPRPHPWSTSIADPSQQYVDFKQEPGKIRTALEGWTLYSNERFAETFFQLLEWLNGDDSHLESNDCAFLPAADNIDAQFSFKKRCAERLMILFRDIYENTQPDSVDWLFNGTGKRLVVLDKEFRAGAIGLSYKKTIYKALSDDPKEGAAGFQVMLSLFAYGKNRTTAHNAMARVIGNLRIALGSINNRVAAGEVVDLYDATQ